MDVNKLVATNYGDWPEKFGESWERQIGHLKKKFPSAVTQVLWPGKAMVDVPVLFIKKESIIEILRYVKSEPDFEYSFLTDLTATDEQPDKFRFNVVYNLFSPNRLWRMRFKVRIKESESMPTAVGVWGGANWAEREIWDMFGIKFDEHPDLRRILMDERWKGHPLRKDYPLQGYQIFPTAEEINPKLLEN